MDLPTDKIHHIRWSYGRIVIPPLFGVGVGWFTYGSPVESISGGTYRGIRGFRRIKRKDFHNCRATGIY